MRPLAYTTLFFAPVLAIVIYLYCIKRYEKSFLKLLITSYLAGMLGISVLLAAAYLGSWLGLNDVRSIKRTLFFSFITIGGSAELGKFLFLRFMVIPNKLVDRPMYAILFSIMAALGFSTVFLLLYSINIFGAQQIFPSTMYTMVFVPANILFAIVMGFFIGMAKFLKARIAFYLIGLLGAAFFHGMFNLCLITHDFKLLSLFSFGSMIIAFILGLKASYCKPEPS